MKIHKPDDQTLLHRCLHWQGRDLLSVGMVALFDLQNASHDALRSETELWQLLPKAPGAPEVLDEGYPKPRAEFMVYGEACAPQGVPVEQLVLSAQVGSVGKRLLVHGERRWNALGMVSSAQPFSRVPVVPAQVGDAQGASRELLPRIEDPRHPVVYRSDAPEPAGFWGVDSSAPRRQKALGTTDADWLRTQWPALPTDTKDEYFQSAPADQRGDIAWRGDEAVALLHWDAEHPQQDSRLPGLRARCFAQRLTPAGETVFEEMPAHAETVWLFPGLGVGAVLYRATQTVNDPEGLDVLQLVAGWEPLTSEPLTPDAYCARTQPPDRAGVIKAPETAAPAPAGVAPRALAAVAGALGAGAAAAAPAAAPHASLIQPLVDKVLADQPFSDADVLALARAAPQDMPQMKDADLKALTKQLLDQRDALLAEHGLSEAQVSAFLKERGASEEAVRLGGMSRAEMEAQFGAANAGNGGPVARADGPPSAALQTMLDKVQAGQSLSAEDVHALAAEAPANAPQITDAQLRSLTSNLLDQRDALLAEHEMGESQVAAFLKERGASAEAVRLAGMSRAEMETQFDTAAQPLMSKVQLAAPAAVAPRLAISQVQALTAQMQVRRSALMAEHGLSEAKVAAFLQERGASAEAISLAGMTRADMEAHFGGADDMAALSQMDVAEAASAAAKQAGLAQDAAADANAFLSAAAESLALSPAFPSAHPAEPIVWTRETVQAHHADGGAFAGQDLSGLDLSALDLSNADFSAATLEQTRFDRSRLAGTRFDNAILQGASFEGADATKASFGSARAAGSQLAGATLAGATFKAADFSGSDFSGAQLQDAQCAKADFSGSRMTGLRGAKLQAEQANFSGCGLEGADLAGATLTAARFDAARMEGAALASVQAERSEWYEAQASKADFTGANLRGARAGAGSVFAGATLRGANLDGAAWSDGVDLQGAAMQSASLERADFSGAQAAGLRLAGANAKGANFSRAALDGADVSGANLMGASLRHAQLPGTRLGGANLHASDVYGSTIVQAHSAGALTTGTLMQIPGRPEAQKA